MEPTDWKDKVISIVLLEFLRVKGFSRTEKFSFETLKQVVVEHMLSLMEQTKQYAESEMRNEVTLMDVLKIMRVNDLSVASLQRFLDSNPGRTSAGADLIGRELTRSHAGVHPRRRLRGPRERGGGGAHPNRQTQTHQVE